MLFKLRFNRSVWQDLQYKTVVRKFSQTVQLCGEPQLQKPPQSQTTTKLSLITLVTNFNCTMKNTNDEKVIQFQDLVIKQKMLKILIKSIIGPIHPAMGHFVQCLISARIDFPPSRKLIILSLSFIIFLPASSSISCDLSAHLVMA